MRIRCLRNRNSREHVTSSAIVRKFAGFALAASLLLPALLVAQSGTGGDADEREPAAVDLLNGPIHFSLRTLAGDSVRVGVGGPTTLVAVFATWCLPCRGEVPALNMLQRDFGDRVRLVAINVDEGNDKHIVDWLKQYGVQYPVARNKPGAAVSLGVAGVPVVFLVDGTGHVEWKHVGALLSSLPGLRAKLKTLPVGLFN